MGKATSADGGWSPLRRIGERLWLADLGGLLFEIGLVWWPLLAYLLSSSIGAGASAGGVGGGVAETRAFLFRVAPAIVILLEAPWWIVVGPRRAALVRAMAIRNSGRPLPTELRRRVMQALDGLPPLGLWLRAGLVGVGAAGLLQLSAMRGFLERDLATLLGVVACGHAFCASALRAAWYDRLLDRRESRLFPDDDPIDRFARRYRRRVQLESLGIGVMALIQIGIYTLVFVPISKTLFAELELLVVLVGFGLLAIWGVLIERVARPIDRYFAVEHNRSAPGTDDRPDEQTAKERAQLAYRSGAKLPLALAAAKLATLLVGIGLVLLLSHRLLPVDREEAGLLGGAATLLALAVSLYEALAQHSIMRPLRIHLASRHRLALSDLGPTMSLRSKMVASFGLLAIFSAGISLYLSFIHYKALATRFIQRETELRLQSMARSLDAKSTTGARLSDAAISEELRRYAIELERSVDEPAIVFFPASGKPHSFGHLSGEQLSDLATLQPPLQSRLVGRSGRIDLPSHRWAGSFLTLTLAGEPRGQIALLQPGYRGRGTSTAPQIRILVVFFVFLIIGSLIVVFIAARDLTAPLRTLEQRAQALAAGDLSRAIPPSGEADEVGSLTLQFEEMRRGLYDRLRSSTEINLALEQEVQKRTAELEGRNGELAQALDALRRAQDELVRAEKLASMGRLVAGIAHEINNPVNAIANTAGPLEQALRSLGSTPLSPDDRDELLAMLSVIQRGAKRTSEIVHALHSYSRREDDRIGDVDLNRVLDETLDLLRHQLKGVTVTKHYQPRAIARGNTGQLGQVFMNLITNAAQAIGQAGNGHIELRTTFVDGRAALVRVEVRDDGPGIPDEVRQRIFDPFFTTKEVGQGSGLGLSIVQSLIDRHGGNISVETSTQPPQRGTKFTVDLPRGAG